MKQHELKKQDHLLQAVATITEQLDRERLESALLSTFTEILPLAQFALYSLSQVERGDEAMLVCEGRKGFVKAATPHVNAMPVAANAALMAALNSGEEFVQPMPEKDIFKAVYPIYGSHGISGFLQIISAKHSESDRQMIRALLKIYSNYLRLLLDSETDTLTGLLNRRTFDQNIGKIIAERTLPDHPLANGKTHQARRKGAPAESHWLAIMDIDHFKKVNDQYGHLYGDEVLLLMARSMRKVFRQKDRLFRFGGEEFVVVLDRTSLPNVRDVLERFRKTLEHHEFPQIGRVTISIGFVRLDKAEAPSVIIGHADQALYYAKQNGRNRVCQYEELVGSGKLPSTQYSEDMQLF